MQGKNSQPNQPKLLYIVISIYITLTLITVCLIYKIISVHGVIFSGATLVIPFWYATSDILTEVYGYKVARNVVWCVIISEFIFISTTFLISKIPSYSGALSQDAYVDIFGQLPRVFLGSVSAIFVGSFSNMYLLSRWKILTKGKYFWMRSVLSSAAGELIFTLVAFFIEFIGKMPFAAILELIIVSYILKLLFLIIASGPSALIAQILKNIEGVNVFDYNTNFNPFKLT